MRHNTILLRLALILALTVLTPAMSPLHAQDLTPIPLDEADFGVARMDALAAGAQAGFTLTLAAGDRVAMDLQGGNDAVRVVAFRASYGDLMLEGETAAFNYLAWAPEDGAYTVVVENTGDAPAAFVLHVVVSPAPLPTPKILTLDANGETIPIGVGEAFQVALDAPAGENFPWQLETYDTSIVSEAGSSAMVALGALPDAMHQEIFTFVGMAPGETTLRFTNASAEEGAVDAFSVTLTVMAAPETPTPEALTLDAEGVAVAAGTLDPQGMARYTLAIEAGASVQAAILPGDTGFVLTVVGADGNPLQTDHAGASSFDQIAPTSQEYTFTVINFGEETQAYQFGVVVTPGVGDINAAAAADADLALGEQLVTQYFDALRASDKEAVRALLSPAFQYVRASGERFGVNDYLDNLPDLTTYSTGDLKVTRDGDSLVATTTMRNTATTAQDKADASTLHLVIFQRTDDDWNVLAHADFTPPVDEAKLLTPPTAPITITAADNGGSVQVAAGARIQVTLPGNPTTGYIWQVTANDESILRPLGYTFTPDADMAGAGGVETFTFQVMAPGVTELELVNSHPWERDVEPTQRFAVNVEALNEWSGGDVAITVGMDSAGQSVALLPGQVLLVVLEGAAGGEWTLVQSDPMVVQPLDEWRSTADKDGEVKARFQRAFLGVAGGTSDLRFEFVDASGAQSGEGYTLSVVVPPLEPGGSGAVAVGESDAGGAFTLVIGDTLVVRLKANPTTGYQWRVMSTNDALLPAAGEPVYASSADLPGAGGVETFRFLAKAAGEAAVQIAEFAPGADDPDRTLDFNVTIVEPVQETGDTIILKNEDAGGRIEVTAGDRLVVELASNLGAGYVWRLTANDGGVLQLQPESGFANASAAESEPGAGAVQRFVFRALTPGVVDLAISLFPPGDDAAVEVHRAQVVVK